MADFLNKAQLGVSSIPPQRVKDLGSDLMGLFGATDKALQTYNTIGANAAKLDHRELHFDVMANINSLERYAQSIPEDDYKGHMQVMDDVLKQKQRFSQELTKYTNHQAAYDAFSEASASSILTVDSHTTEVNKRVLKANQLSILYHNGEIAEGGLSNTNESFAVSQESLSAAGIGDDVAIDKTQGQFFAPLLAQASSNKDSQDMVSESSVIDTIAGYATHSKVSDFVNKHIFKNSELAQLYIKEDKQGNKTFGVTSPFSEEQNAKLVAMAEFYMNKYTPKESSYPFYILDGNIDMITEQLGSITPTTPIKDMQRIILSASNTIKQYQKSGEFTHIAGDKPATQKFAKLIADVKTKSNFVNALHSAKNSNKTVEEVANGGVTYEVVNPASIIYPDDKTIINKKANISSGDIEARYETLNTQASTYLANGKVVEAMALSHKYKQLTNKKSSFEKRMDTFINTGVNIATSKEEMSLYKTYAEDQFSKHLITREDYVHISTVVDATLAASKPDDKTLSPAAAMAFNDSMRQKSTMTFGVSSYDREIIKAVRQNAWFRDYGATPAHIGGTIDYLMANGLLTYSSTAEEKVDAVIANSIETVGKILVPKLRTSNGVAMDTKQMTTGMEKVIAKEQKDRKHTIDIDKKTTIISLDQTKTKYKIMYKMSSGVYAPPIFVTPQMLVDAVTPTTIRVQPKGK